MTNPNPKPTEEEAHKMRLKSQGIYVDGIKTFENLNACEHLRHAMVADDTPRICQTCQIKKLEAKRQAWEKEKKELTDRAYRWMKLEEGSSDKIEALEKEKAGLEERVRELEFVPGHSECPKCGFYLVQSILHPGGISPDKKTPPQCPNDGTEMISVRWMKHCQNMQKGQEAILERAVRSEEELTRLKARNEELERDKDNLLHSVERLGEWRDDIQKRFDERYATPNEHEKHLIAQPLREEISRLKAELHEATLRASEYKNEWESALYREQGLKAENERLRDFSKSYDVTENSVYQEAKKEISRLSASLAATREALDKIHKMPESSGCGDEQRIAQEALSDKDGTLALERWKRMWEVITYANTVRNDILIPETDDQVEMSCQCKAWVDGLLERLQALEALEAKGGVSE